MEPETDRVEFRVQNGEVVTSTAGVICQNNVLKMLLQYSLREAPDKPVEVHEERRTFETLLRDLAGEEVNLGQTDYTDLIGYLRCAHRYQHYPLASQVMRRLIDQCDASNVLHLLMEILGLPELPANADDPTAPSAPPDPEQQQLGASDPEQARFSKLLSHGYQLCLQVINTQSKEVLTSDALLTLGYEQTYWLGQQDLLAARELDIGLALLRWLRHYCLFNTLDDESRRTLVLGSLRLLTMSSKDVKKLDLEKYNILTRDELEAVLRYLHQGSYDLPESLAPYRDHWDQPRRQGGGGRKAGFLRRMVGRTRPAGVQYRSTVAYDTAERRETAEDRKRKRMDKVKLALATGASMLFD